MSIEKSNTVDLIGVSSSTGEVILTITDHLPWGKDDQTHLLLLQEKLNTYLRFVESGEVYEEYSNAKGRPIVFEVVAKYERNEQAVEFYSKVSPIVESAGINLRYSQLSA